MSSFYAKIIGNLICMFLIFIIIETDIKEEKINSFLT